MTNDNPMNQGAFSRIAVVNRGEPAMRLINAVREWNEEGRPALRVIAVYTAADRRATFVREADEAVLIGPADPGEAFAASPYLDYAELERALRACRADAVWPGWGFVSEKAEFAELCERLGITFIGPSADVMRRLGDKIESKRLAEAAGVPLAAWSGGPVADVGEARAKAESIGYPLMVKATAGGGGRGIRLVQSAEQLDEAFERASSEASKTAGDATVFLERAIRGGHHVEVQVVADAKGTVWTLGVRDCSVQRRNQKVIEESASTALDAEQEKMVRSHAAELIRAAGYVNAATVEFLYQPGERLLSFLEVNTRLQVEHPVTEATTGLDIVKLQLHIAAGGTLTEIAPDRAADLRARPPRRRRPGQAGPLPLLRRPGHRRRAGNRTAAGTRGTRPSFLRPARQNHPDRRHRRLGRADPRRLHRAGPRGHARGDDPALLPDQAPGERKGHRTRRPPAGNRRVHPRRAGLPGHRDRGPGHRKRDRADLPELADALPTSRTVLVDLYVTSQTPEDEADTDPDRRAGRISDKLGVIPPSVERVTVAVRKPGDGWPAWFTFRPGQDGVPQEDQTQRGLHPMVAERLGLWRFSRFELTRLPAAPDVHLFRIQGREVPDDQRLMALADVRDVTVLRDEDGRVRGLPQLERTLDDCLDSLRAARSGRP